MVVYLGPEVASHGISYFIMVLVGVSIFGGRPNARGLALEVLRLFGGSFNILISKTSSAAVYLGILRVCEKSLYNV